jgi:hypothetical protein
LAVKLADLFTSGSFEFAWRPAAWRIRMLSTRARRSVIPSAVAGLLACAALSAAPAGQTASNSPRERFSAVAVNISTVGRTGATPVDITISRWTTDAERDRLVSIFKEKGAKALLSALQDMRPVGTINTPGNIAYDLRYARQLPGEDGGRRIVLATDRPIGFWEASNQPRSAEYPFLLIELRMNKNGEGEGKLSLATKLTLNDNVLVIENYANQPVMLNEVRQKK